MIIWLMKFIAQEGKFQKFQSTLITFTKIYYSRFFLFKINIFNWIELISYCKGFLKIYNCDYINPDKNYFTKLDDKNSTAWF